jgi:hypothetical protein
MTGLDLSEFNAVLHKLGVHAMSTDTWAKNAQRAVTNAIDRGLGNEEMFQIVETARKTKNNKEIIEDILVQFNRAYNDLKEKNTAPPHTSESPSLRRKSPAGPKANASKRPRKT